MAAAGEAAGKFQVFDFSLDPTKVYTFWAGPVRRHRAHAGHARHRSVPRAAAALGALGHVTPRRGLILSGFIVFAQFMLFLVIGVMLYTFYQHTPLPRAARAHRRDPAALRRQRDSARASSGFIVAAIVAAALSPSINALAATTVNDFYVKYVRPDADEDA